MYEVESHNKATHQFTWSKGGFQGGRGWQLNGTSGAVDPTPPFYIENVFEEMDIGSEWFYDKEERKLYVKRCTPSVSSLSPVSMTHQYDSSVMKNASCTRLQPSTTHTAPLLTRQNPSWDATPDRVTGSLR